MLPSLRSAASLAVHGRVAALSASTRRGSGHVLRGADWMYSGAGGDTAPTGTGTGTGTAGPLFDLEKRPLRRGLATWASPAGGNLSPGGGAPQAPALYHYRGVGAATAGGGLGAGVPPFRRLATGLPQSPSVTPASAYSAALASPAAEAGGQAGAPCSRPLRILFLTNAHNSLSQRAYLELVHRGGHSVNVELATSEKAMVDAVERHQPELIVCPFLTKRVPERIWRDTKVRGPGGACVPLCRVRQPT
jgi:hypothetical protein